MISAFKYTKSELIVIVKEAFKFIKTRSTLISIVQVDNAGENMIIKRMCKKNIAVEVEFTPPETPKLNGIVERAFAIKSKKAKILMKNTGFKGSVKINKNS